jgi:glycosyltransferase involved in cell wall biosynthesis
MNTEFSFSICMPVYQGSHLIGNSIDSIRKQGFENYEGFWKIS